MKAKIPAIIGIVGGVIILVALFLPLLTANIEVVSDAGSVEKTAQYTMLNPTALELELPWGETYDVKLWTYLNSFEKIMLYLLPVSFAVAILGTIAVILAKKRTLLMAGGAVLIIGAVSCIIPVIMLMTTFSRIRDDLEAEISALAADAGILADVNVGVNFGLGSIITLIAGAVLVISAILAFISTPRVEAGPTPPGYGYSPPAPGVPPSPRPLPPQPSGPGLPSGRSLRSRPSCDRSPPGRRRDSRPGRVLSRRSGMPVA